MNAKEIKGRLKDAREAIRAKDFEGAAAHCRAILETEQANYNALVFLGVACEGLDQVDQALQSYKKATSEFPEQPLAWQGIGAMIEKSPHLLDVQERIKIYEKLQSFTTGSEGKRVSHLHKLVSLYKGFKNEDKAYETLKELLEVEKEGEGRVTSCEAMVDLLSGQKLSQDEIKSSEYLKCLDELLECPTLTEEDINKYTRLLLFSRVKTSDEGVSLKWKDLNLSFPKAIPPLEFGLHIYLDQTIGATEVNESTIEGIKDMCDRLDKLSADNEVLKTAQGFMAIHQKKHMQAKDYLIGVTSPILSAQYYLCRVYWNLHDLTNCLKICTKGLKTCSEPESSICYDVEKIGDMLRLVQADAHRQMGSEDDQATALKILAQVEDRRSNEALIIKAYLYLDQGRLDDAENCVSSLPQDQIEKMMLKVIIVMAQKQYKDALDILQDVLSQDSNNAVATLKKGIVLWELRNSSDIEDAKQQCFTALLKAAKLDPYNFESFLYLGYFYEQVQKDITKGMRCYRKAYDLNPNSDEAGCAYVDSLSDQQDQNQALEVLKTVTSKAPAGKAKWAWLRLGLYQMKYEDPSNAITSLQSALRADPKDNHVWECLSEAYLHRGSLTAALKAFTKASELNPDSTYCLYQIANIKQTLGLLSEAVDQYRSVLDKEPAYVAALKGLGESLIQCAKQNLHQCLDGLAQDNVQEALAVLTRGASLRPDFSCLWKLMGDSCTLVSSLAADSYRIPSKLLSKTTEGQEMVSEVTKIQLLQIGGRCYSQAVKILPETAALWHDLGINLYRQACQQHQDKHLEVATELLGRSRKALEKALGLDANNWMNWNALGVMACSKVDAKLPFAQHCFIKSVECANNVVAWSNLGVLYLSEGDIGLAHDAFKVAQRLDPTYLVGWLGQALIAEAVGHEEAMDLFRHTTELGIHLESEIGYGQQVLAMLRDGSKQSAELFQYCIQRMAAIPAASDALIKYTTRVQTDPIAYNMLGLLLEHQNLISSSVEAFAKAMKLLEENNATEMMSQVRMNYARTLCTLGQYKDSLAQFELLGSDLTLEHLFVYALAAYKMDNYVDSFRLYNLALEQVADDDGLKSQVHTALAMVAFKAGDLDEAKTQLFNGFQTSSPSLHGVLAMCALGLHQRDTTLARAALEELDKRPDTTMVVESIALLTLYKHILEGSNAEGESSLKELMESHPQDSRKLWMVLASFLITTFSHRGNEAVECLKSVHEDYGNLNTSEEVTKTLALLQAGGLLHHNADINPFKAAQKAFHQNPGEASTVATLACAVHAEGVLRKPLDRHLKLFRLEKALLIHLGKMIEDGENVNLKLWQIQQLIVCCAELNDSSLAQQCLGLLKEEASDNTKAFVDAMTLFLYATPIADWSKQDNMLSIMVVCSLLAVEENDAAVIDLLKTIVEQPNEGQKNLPIDQLLALWTHTAFKNIHPKKLQEDKDTEGLFNQGVSTSIQREVKSPIISIMEGVWNFRKSKKDAKHHFATALDQSEGRADATNCRSVARQGLISLMADSTKESDLQLIEALVKDAKSDSDTRTAELHDKFFKK